MARQARKKSASGIYHVCLRGINHQCMFEEEEDYDRFISTLQYVKQQYSKECNGEKRLCTYYAYCLMPNHVHLLVRERDESIGKIMQKISDSYTYYFNQKYGRDGHFFKERFRSEPVDDMNYFVTLLRYIHRNPVEGHVDGVKSVADYKYSSWAEYTSPESVNIRLCDVRATLSRMSIEELSFLVNKKMEEGIECIDIEEDTAKRPPDDIVMTEFAGLTGNMSVTEFQRLDIKMKKQVLSSLRHFGASIRQLERLTGVSRGIIQDLKS